MSLNLLDQDIDVPSEVELAEARDLHVILRGVKAGFRGDDNIPQAQREMMDRSGTNERQLRALQAAREVDVIGIEMVRDDDAANIQALCIKRGSVMRKQVADMLRVQMGIIAANEENQDLSEILQILARVEKR